MPAPSSVATASGPFTLRGGDPSTDFVNTSDWTTHGLENDRLRDYAALAQWGEQVGVLSRPLATRLRQLATEHPAGARAAMARARELRALLHRVFGAVAAGRGPDAADLDGLNGMVGLALRRLTLAPPPARQGRVRPPAAASAATRGATSDTASPDPPPENPLAWTWRSPETDLGAVLWPVARAAATLLTSEDARRIRVCAGPNCGWVYVDRSRNGHRRWCEMRTCGARAKARRYYARRRA